jgi:hypothetical protein
MSVVQRLAFAMFLPVVGVENVLLPHWFAMKNA